MKSNSKIILAALALAALTWTGCEKTQYPSSYLSSGSGNPALVADFESGFVVSSNLAEANRPGNHVVSPGTIIKGGYASSVVTLVPSALAMGTPGFNGSGQCAHLTGSFIDAGDASYPALSLQIPLEAANLYYDASLFTGIRFYLKTAVGDAAASRTFSIPIGLTTVASAGGVCDLSPYTSTSNPCYNNFAVSYSATNGGWKKTSVPFSTMARGTYGAAISPTDLSGNNLKQVLQLQWSEGNQNAAGTVNVDLSVDQVEFY